MLIHYLTPSPKAPSPKAPSAAAAAAALRSYSLRYVSEYYILQRNRCAQVVATTACAVVSVALCIRYYLCASIPLATLKNAKYEVRSHQMRSAPLPHFLALEGALAKPTASRC